MPESLVILALLFAVLSAVFFLAALAAWRKRRPFRITMRLTLALLMLSLAALFGTIAVSTHGYRRLTREEVAAVVRTEPMGPQSFKAWFRFPDGREATFHLAGDELYVDAHILKWKPVANIFGLHTAYELDRVAGRYTKLQQEQARPRTVFALAQEKPVDLFDLRRRTTLLKPLVDAEYGSATFVPAGKPEEFEVRVSTTGLLIRRVRQGTP